MTVKFRSAAFAALAAFGLVSQSSQAAIIEGFDFAPLAGGAGNFGPATYASTTSDANVTTIGLSRGNTILSTGSGAAHAYGSNNFSITAANKTDAITASNFFTFGVTVNAGYTLSLSDIGAFNVRRSSSGPSTGVLQYSLNGSSFTDIGSPATFGAVTTSAGNPQTAITLSGISDLQGIAEGTTVTFREVVYGATSTGGTFYFNDPLNTSATDFSLNGVTTPVTGTPEPASLSLLGLGGLAMVARRRRSI